MSDLRVTNLRGRSSGTPPTMPDGAIVTGVATATQFSGNLVGTAATVGSATTITTGGINVTGIVTATSFTGTVASSNLSGALPALDGSALTNLNIPSSFSELDAALFN
jgi:hypothetical protein|tara:strand:- start:490 stop:813 length:324 start_codon:yes stop_codon:yes gene_type:complete